MKILLHEDSSSRKFNASKTFGLAISFETEYSVTERIPDVVQPIGDVSCLAISSCDVAGDKDGVLYDYKELFSRIPHNQFGAIPQDAFNEDIKNGFLPQGQTQRIKVFNSYYNAHEGGYDAFDSVRSALVKLGYPVIAYTNFYANWNGQTVLPIGQNPVSGHAYTVDGWKVINGETMLVCEMWLGHKVHMSRAVFNDAVGKLGCGTAVFSTLKQDIQTRRNLIEYIIDLCKNAILLLKSLPVTTTTMPTPVVTPSQKLYDLSYSLIGKHLTLDNTVPKEFGCAQAGSYVLKEFGLPIPKMGISSTNEMDQWLRLNCTEVHDPKVGDIMIAISTPQKHGHFWIIGKKALMSNDSDTGLWQPYWSMAGALNTYQKEYQLTIKYYRI